MSKMQEMIFKIAAALDPSFNKNISGASDKMNDMAKGAKDISGGFSDAEQSGKSFGEGASASAMDVGEALAAAGIVALLGKTAQAFMECTEAAAEYEAAIAKISTIADSGAMTGMRDEITALSQDTGQSVNELSESVYQAISASVESAEAVEFVRQANMLAIGGFTDTTTAVDVLTTAINAYGLETAAAGEISDMLVTTQKLGKTTVGELGSTLGSVIPTAAAYKVNMENISAAMVEMTKQGVNTANAGTALRGMLSELAKDGSTVSDILKEQTGKSFSTLMEDGKTLGDVLNILGESVNGDSTAFANLFSNVRAKQGALAIFNAGAQEFNGTVDQMKNSIGATGEAYGKMENTAEHAQKVFANSAENMKIAIGEQLSPAITKIYEIGAKVMQGVTAFVKEHPEAVAAVTGVAVAVGAFAVALIGYTAASKVAAVATAALTAVMDTNPVFLAISAFAALALGIAAFAAAADNAAGRGKELTVTSQAQKDELDRLNAEYDETVEKFGKTSEQALILKEKIGELTEKYEENKRTYGEMLTEQSKISEEYAKLRENDKSEDLELEAATAGRLVTKLFNLAEQTNITSAAQEEMKAIVAKLNAEYEGLDLTYDDVINKTAATKEALQGYLKSLYNKKQYENAQEQWTETYGLLERQKQQYQELSNEFAAASKKYYDSFTGDIPTAWAYNEYQEFANKTVEYVNSAGETVKGTMREALDESKSNIESMEGELKGYEQTMLDVAGANDKAAESEKSWETAASEAIQGVQGDLDKLAAAYDEAFTAAQKSIQSTVGLTTELSNKTDVTTAQLTHTWETQTDWINKYSENLQKAQKYGITEGLIDSLSDGSQESGQYINQIIGELDNLNAQDAKALVDKLNKNFENVQNAEGKFAKTVAAYKTDFEKNMNDIQSKAQQAISKLDLSKDAEKSATNTIQAYIKEINKQVKSQSFVNLAGTVQSAVTSVLTPKGIFAYSQTPAIEENANGTRHSADVFLAGEKGPELIINAKGSQVFTAAETKRILSGYPDENGSAYSFDVPELIRQLAEQPVRPSFEEMAAGIDSETSYDNHSSTVRTINYSPTYQINGASGSGVIDGVKQADRLSKAEFAKMMREYEQDVKRITFK